jgi:hypothetical protein
VGDSETVELELQVRNRKRKRNGGVSERIKLGSTSCMRRHVPLLLSERKREGIASSHVPNGPA